MRPTRTQEIRDEMLIDMARGLQLLLGGADYCVNLNANSVIGRLEAHIDMLRRAARE